MCQPDGVDFSLEYVLIMCEDECVIGVALDELDAVRQILGAQKLSISATLDLKGM